MPMRPDAYFTDAQRQRLGELMARWRTARDGGVALSAEEQAELDALIEAEVRAAADRAAGLLRQPAP
jgi:Spy/CpxP family protein refolding chaperone